MDKARTKQVRNMKIAIGITVGAILFIYLGFSLYFMNHFYLGSYINDINYSGKTVEEVEENIAGRMDDYSLEIQKRSDKSEFIGAWDIDLQYVSDGMVQKLKDQQNPFTWFIGCFQKETNDMAVTVVYDEDALANIIDGLQCLDPDQVTNPKNAYAQYAKGSYAIVDEVYGNQVNKKKFKSLVMKAIKSGETLLSLEDKNCYVNPKVKADNPQLIKSVQTLNQYVKAEVTYDFEDRTETLTSEVFHNWFVMDDTYQITIDEQSVIDYIKTLESVYNTLGKSREFVTTDGKTVVVPSGNYGFMISRGNEKEKLISNILNGEVVKREPVYALRGYVRTKNDIGDTYVEISLAKQKMWFYKDGKQLVKTKIVTGNIGRGFGTPIGVYGITYKERDATLVGENYSSPVTFWLPFNENIGIHDATWRNKFGGDIYKTNGSHGCVNTPYKKAKVIFDNIEKGVPVIVY